MNPLIIQQVALDKALVLPENHVEIGKCNMRIDPNKPQKKPLIKLSNQEFVDPPSQDEMVTFIKSLGYKDTRKAVKASLHDLISQYQTGNSSEGADLEEDWGSEKDDVILTSKDERTESEKETTKSGKNDDDISIDLDETDNEEDEHVNDETQRDEYVLK
nr:hypothetical protein [Tanacetum cinerariifolium]